MRELVASVSFNKPLIALIDPEVSHGGVGQEDVRTQLVQADNLATQKWGFRLHESSERHTSERHGPYVWPGGDMLYNHLFQQQPIEWNRESARDGNATAAANAH